MNLLLLSLTLAVTVHGTRSYFHDESKATNNEKSTKSTHHPVDEFRTDDYDEHGGVDGGGGEFATVRKYPNEQSMMRRRQQQHRTLPLFIEKLYSHNDNDTILLEDNEEFVNLPNDNPFLSYGVPFSISNYRKQHQQQQQQQYNEGIVLTKEIAVKQGRLQGVVRVMHPQSGLKNVDQYFGIPYADALRFMPPGAPPPWNGLKLANKLPPVCPQSLPNINTSMSKGRYSQIKRLLPYLKEESEDCLHLNLYVPSNENLSTQTKYPVIVYIHGESYEWNSGNPYDGSILASYGQIIIVTVNYRLGVLGFMKPGISEHTVSNFGLLDQIAALQWVKENIEAFNGNKNAVTLMGHGTGSACVNFLMVSPVAKGLFHRAILMSGSALSDWAMTQHPLQSTMQVAQGLNCPLTDEHEEMLACLRKKRYQDILAIKVSSPQFSTKFGPVVDGLVIPNVPHKVMGQYSDIFSRYDLLFGMTELESYHILNAIALTYGLRENERDNMLRFYMQNRFEFRPDLALAATLKEYTDIYGYETNLMSEVHRDIVLEILSDARVASPMVQTGSYLSKVNPKCYMYVFAHNSEAGEYVHLSQSVIGEELAYVFGAPLGQVGPFQPHYNVHERLFSEAVMKYWSNFAKTGNPKAPWRELFFNLNPKDWRNYDVDWPEFNTINQSYLHLSPTPVIGYKYRDKYMKFWNQNLPAELKKNTSDRKFPPPPYYGYLQSTASPRKVTSARFDSIITGHMNKFPGQEPTEATRIFHDPIHELRKKLNEDENSQKMYNSPAAAVTTTLLAATTEQVEFEPENPEVLRTEFQYHILLALLAFFVLVNIILIVVYIVRRTMNQRKFKDKFEENIFDANTDKRSKFNETDESYILDLVKKPGNNQYEPIKVNQSPVHAFGLQRQLSSSTMDAHTKVCDWITHDIGKYSPKVSPKVDSPRMFGGVVYSSVKPQKVSVAIDATPAARSNSVLRQEPIEVTKAKSFDYADGLYNCAEECRTRSNSCSSIDDLNAPIVIDHKHSKSDPVPMAVRSPYDEEITSFIEPEDINVTCRDEYSERDILSPEEALKVIQRRNFPKVLPNFPEMSDAMKRRSLPPQYFLAYNSNSLSRGIAVPMPTLPPRSSSTLGRKPSTKKNTFGTSQAIVAEEPPEPNEPVITLNTLHVGPLIPAHQEMVYSTLKKDRATETSHPEVPQVQVQVQPPPPPIAESSGAKKSDEKIYSSLKNAKIKRPSYIKPPTISLSKENLHGKKDEKKPTPKQALETVKVGSKIPKFSTKEKDAKARHMDKSSSESSTDTSGSTGTVKLVKH